MRVARRRGIVFRVRIALLLLLLFLAAARTMAERLPIKTYTTADGLARDQVNRIVQDSRGFLWFCTSEGLSRFDGYKFTNYGTEQGLPGRQVTDFLEARNGFYWVATNQGLCRFIPDAPAQATAGAAPQRFLVYYPGETPKSRSINAIYEDHAGTIWCCTEQGLYRADQVGKDTVVSSVDIIEPGPHDTSVPLRVGAVVEDRRGSLYIISISGVYRLRPDGIVERYTVEEGLPDAMFLEDRNGLIWVGARFGLYRLVPDPVPHQSIVARRYTVKDGLAGDAVSALCQSSDGTLLIGHPTGLTRFNRQNEERGRFQAYTKGNGLSGITALCEDRDHNLWIGTNAGAMRLAASAFVTYTEADGLGGIHPGASNVASIFQNQAGELCVFGGTSPNIAISRFDGRRFTAVPLTLPHGVSYWSWGWYQVMFQDHLGEWWMSTGQGLVRYPRLTSLEQITRARPKAIYKTRDGLPADDIFRLYEDSRGDIWISTLGNAGCVMTRWERATETFHRYSLADVAGESAPTAFCEDSLGNLWIGFYNGGLERYRVGRFTKFTEADGVPPGFIQGLYSDRAGRLWIATGEGGVGRVDQPGDERPSFAAYTTANGLSSNQANSVTEDQWGMIYVGTGRGLDKLDPATGHIRHYTSADGLGGNSVGVSFRDQAGSLWFSTLQGLSRLDPQSEQPASPPPILITAIHVAGAPYSVPEMGAGSVAGPELAANQNNVQIEFSGLSFAAGETLRYQYKLEGTPLDWSAPSDQRIVTYPNLQPGSYRFLVRSIRSDGTMSVSPAVVSFSILPPVWQRLWFRALALIMIAIPLAAIARYRYQRIKAVRDAEQALQKSREERLAELERVRTRIATDLHDDIGSSLTQIAILGEVAHQNVEGGDSERGAESLERIVAVSNELVDTMSDIVWAINPKKDHLGDLVQRMRRFASDIFTSRGISFAFHAPAPERDIELGANLRREVFLIFKESVNNIVKHSGCTRAAVTLQAEGDWLTLEVADNGRGFECNGSADTATPVTGLGEAEPYRTTGGGDAGEDRGTESLGAAGEERISPVPRGGNGIINMRRRAEEMGGRFEIASSDGKGTTATLRVFVAQQTAGNK